MFKKILSALVLGGVLIVLTSARAAAAPQQELTRLVDPGGFAFDLFGESVAVDGDTIVVGTTKNSIVGSGPGAAYVFTRQGDLWPLTAVLRSTEDEVFDDFGVSVAISGDTIVVGASGDSYDSDDNRGTAYVFSEPEGGWYGTLTEAATLRASDGDADDFFGFQVGIDGGTVAVSAFGTDSRRGSVYIFTEPDGGWSGLLNEDAVLEATDREEFDDFGISMAVDGNTVVAGAYGDNDYQGEAYVFTEPGGGWSGTLTESASLTASDGVGGGFSTGDRFGISVDVSGGTVVVGAEENDVADNVDQGSAYVFVEPGGGWSGTLTENAALRASDGEGSAPLDDGDKFGSSVTVDGSTIVVSAPDDDVEGLAGQGTLYAFAEPTGGWSGTLTEGATLRASDPQEFSGLGARVALSGEIVVAGAPTHNIGTNTDQGAAYVFGFNPTAADDTLRVNAGQTASVDVLTNDSDFTGSTLTITAVGDPTTGRVSITPDGLTYTHDGSPSVSDSFTYTVENAAGLSATATVTVGVNPNLAANGGFEAEVLTWAPTGSGNDGVLCLTMSCVYLFDADNRLEFIRQDLTQGGSTGQTLTLSYASGTRGVNAGAVTASRIILFYADGSQGVVTCVTEATCSITAEADFDAIAFGVGWVRATEGVFAVDDISLFIE